MYTNDMFSYYHSQLSGAGARYSWYCTYEDMSKCFSRILRQSSYIPLLHILHTTWYQYSTVYHVPGTTGKELRDSKFICRPQLKVTVPGSYLCS